MIWKRTRLKYLAAVPITSGVGEPGTFDNPDWPRYVRTTDIAGPRALRTDVFASLPHETAAKALLRRGDIVMTAAGATVGKSMLYESDEPACYAGYLARFRPAPDVHPRFVSYWTESTPYWDQIGSGKVVSTIDNFSAGKYQNLWIGVPAFDEQRAIADYLDAETARIDALVALRRRQVELLEVRFDALREVWVQRLRREHGSLALKRMAQGIEQGWSPECEATRADPDEWGVLKTSAVSGGRFEAAENKRLALVVDPDPRWVVHDGDLLVVRGSGSPGAVAQAAVAVVNGRKLLLPDLLYRVRLVGGDPWFVAHALRSRFARDQFEAAIRTDVGMTRKIRTNDLASVQIPAVPRSKQGAAAEALAASEAQITSMRVAADRQVALLLERRQTLITAAVTGQLEIPGVAA